MKYLFFLTCTFLLILSCNEKQDSKESSINYIEIVKAQTTPEQKIAFMQGIHDTNERLRRELPKIIQKYGYQSEQHIKAKTELDQFTKQSLKKSMAYLDVWGYPDKQAIKSNAAEAPFYMFHYSNDVSIKRKYFPILWQAMKDRDIPSSAIAKFLNKWYEIEKGEAMMINGAFQESFELDTLLRSLNIDPRTL